MDACDPGLDIRNLRSLVKQNTGTDLKLSKNQICEVYSYIQGGKLPLPPLILSKDGSYLIDAKSPLTRKDYDTLFKSTSKVDDLRKIAKKVGVIRYANKKLTKQQLIDIIGRRLHGLKVYEPIKLRSIQKKQIENFNNDIIAFNENANTNNVNNLNSLSNVNNVNVNNVNGTNSLNNINNVNRLNNVNKGGNNLNKVNNVNRLNNVNRGGNNLNRVNNVNRGGNNLNRVNYTNFKAKNQTRPRFLNVNHRKTPTSTITTTNTKNYKAFTTKKPNKPTFLNKNFIKTNKFISKPGYVFKRNNKGLGMYKNKPPVQGPVGPPTPAPTPAPAPAPAPAPTPTPTPTPAPVPNKPIAPNTNIPIPQTITVCLNSCLEGFFAIFKILA